MEGLFLWALLRESCGEWAINNQKATDIAMVWINNSQGCMCQRTGHQVIELWSLSELGPSARKSVHWGCALQSGYWDAGPSSCPLFLTSWMAWGEQLPLMSSPALMCCPATDPKATVNQNKPVFSTADYCRYFVTVTQSWWTQTLT